MDREAILFSIACTVEIDRFRDPVKKTFYGLPTRDLQQCSNNNNIMCAVERCLYTSRICHRTKSRAEETINRVRTYASELTR